MERQNLDILPGGVLPVIHCSQGDIGREFQINLFSDNAPYILDGTEELTIDGHKEDNNIFTYSIPATTGSTITISTQEQMTACAGNTICEIRIYKDNMRIGTCNFILQVEEGPSDGTLSDTALQALDEIRAEVQQAVTDAQTAQHNAEIAETNAETAETNARNAQSQSENARDLAQTYATNSSNSATDSENSALQSKSWAVGPSGSGSGTDTNNAKYYSQLASQSEQNASASATNASNSASTAHTSETNASNSASAAHISEVNASNSAGDANTAKLGAEAAQQKIENMTASASQLPEGSTPTVTKSEVGGVVNLAFGIPKGDTGATGPKGEDGLGVPSGGTTGQVLAKASNTDNDTEWIDVQGGGSTTVKTYRPLSDSTTTLYMTGDNQTISEVKYLWTDGEDIYYYPTGQYVYKLVSIENRYITLETITKTAIGLPDSPSNTIGTNIWYNPLDDTIYYLDTYIWNKSTKTWSSVTKRFSNISSFEPPQLFTDGNKLLYLINSVPTPTIYKLIYDGYSYDSVTQYFSNVPTSVNSLGFWTDNINLYYSDHSGNYIDGDWIINTENYEFTSITWTVDDGSSTILDINGSQIWSNGDDIYWDNGSSQHYKLNKSNNKWTSRNVDSGGGYISGTNIFLGPDNYYYVILDWNPSNWIQLKYKYNPKVKPM